MQIMKNREISYGKPLIGTEGTTFRVNALRQVNGFDKNVKDAGEDLDVVLKVREQIVDFSK